MKNQTKLIFLNLIFTFSFISPAQETTLEGPVVKKLWAAGSHSEHMAVVMQTSQGNFKLRRMGGNPFSDPKLEIYVGRSWSCTGTLLGSKQFMIRQCTPSHELEELSDESTYQLNHILGDWDTWDDTIFKNWGIRIFLDQSSNQIRLQYCDLWKLRYTKECHKVLNEEGTLSYSPAHDNLTVIEGPHSPNPQYWVQVNPSNPNKFLRTWGTRKIEYGRIN